MNKRTLGHCGHVLTGRSRLALAVSAMAFTMAAPAMGQSEDCFDASLSPLTLGTPVTGNFTDSFNDGPSGCGSTANRTQWFTFTPATSGRYMFTTCGSAQLDTHLGIALSNQPCEGIATYLACNDDACGAAAQVTASLIGGNEYRIRVGAFGAPTNGGSYTILVLAESSTPPANDDCPDALPATLGMTSGTTLGASGALNLNTCAGTADSNDVYFQFTPPNTRRYRFSVCSAQFDSVLSVHSACPAGTLDTFQLGAGCAGSVNPPVPGCANRGALTNVGLMGGQPVWIRVAGAADQSGTGSPFVGFGSFDLLVDEVTFTRPDNDECDDAFDLNMETLPFVHGVEGRGAFNDADPGGCNSSVANEGFFGVWYRFVAPSTGILVVSEQSPADATIGIWEFMVPPIDPCVDLGDSIRCSDTETVVERVISGRTYFIQVGSFDSAGPSSAYSTRFNFLPEPTNDLCPDATDISSEMFPFEFELNALDADNDPAITPLDTTCNAGQTVNASVYWTFTAPLSGGRLTLRETATDNDVAWTIFTGSCASPTQVVCFTADNADANFLDVQPGQTYIIQLSRQPTTPATGRYVGTIDFEPPPSNDECIDAITVTEDFFWSNSLATQSMIPADPVCGGMATAFEKDTWFRYVAPDDGALSVLPLSNQSNTLLRFALYRSATCSGIDAGFYGCTNGPNFINIPDLAAGEVVYIRIGGVMTGDTFTGFTFVTFVPQQGACCLSGGDCQVISESACTLLGGVFSGNGTLCVTPDTMNVPVFLGGPGGLIPDNNADGAAFTFNLPGAPTDVVGAVRVDVNLQHSFLGDLVLSLEKDGRSVVLANRTRRGLNNAFGTSADLSGVYAFDDGATTSWWPAASGTLVPTAVYRSSTNGDLITSLTEAFNGVERAGTWTLRVSDMVGSDTGSVLGWSLSITPSDGNPPCGVSMPCPGDYNGDGVVDLVDLIDFNLDWQPNIGLMGMGLTGDYNGDSFVDLADLIGFNIDWQPAIGLPCP